MPQRLQVNMHAQPSDWHSAAWRPLACGAYLEDLKPGNVEDSDEGGALARGAV